eukprot:CAMPEP_0172499340 /NCGR_PEP_ID=MMETSP1066-20121228/125872_1 /TAXON_ID=671091 /ORGANISM="Coscinodiscus wailesii, Strain CCMP2513" /LENGTH=66 /DNA_ID=CAMNT_0013273031 /DNA_START=379 /DNA_END=576 /DNA_ORIENTATION=-
MSPGPMEEMISSFTLTEADLTRWTTIRILLPVFRDADGGKGVCLCGGVGGGVFVLVLVMVVGCGCD